MISSVFMSEFLWNMFKQSLMLFSIDATEKRTTFKLIGRFKVSNKWRDVSFFSIHVPVLIC